MKTKIEAAKICQLAGCYMAIANGNYINPIKKIIAGQKCTWFLPKISKLYARKQWIIGSIAPKGEIIIDHGAVNAIRNKKVYYQLELKKLMEFLKKVITFWSKTKIMLNVLEV